MAKRRKDDEDQSRENPGNNGDSADNFGLPDIDYKPLDRAEEISGAVAQEETLPEPERSSYSYQAETPKEEERVPYVPMEEPKSNAPMIIGLIIGLVVVVAGFLIYFYVYKPKAEKARQEQIERAALKKKEAEEARLAKLREEEERKRREAEAAANAKPAIGAIETLTERTKRYYVVVSSNVDDDLIMDYAKKLSAKGISTKIIPPFGKTKFYRIAIADHDTFALAQTNADAAKAEYGSALWVIKY
jgi:ribosomal protein L9